MIAKIGRGSKIYGALVYNHTKVLRNTSQILHLNNMLESPDGNYTTRQLLFSFLPNLVANKKTEKTAIHISLNPDPHDNVSDEDFIKIAHEYMTKMGYGEQPYVVFKHNDIDRTHIHIVSTSVDKNGIKISDSFEKKRSMDICRELEKKYGLIPANEKIRNEEHLSFLPIDHSKGDIKSQIAAIVRYLPQYYQFQTLGSYNALLSLFNVTSEYIKKEYRGELKEGLVYFAIDENGQKISNPFKSSLFGKHAGLKELKSHFDKSKATSAAAKLPITEIIQQAMQLNSNEKDFKDYLIQQGINSVIRRNEQDRIYGITFIDHNTRNVFNGSQLGKQFSANTFQEWFSHNKQDFKEVIENKTPISVGNSIKTMPNRLTDEIHPIFDFMIDTGQLLGGFGFFDTLLLDTLSEDPEEQIFEFNMKKKKRRTKR